MKPILVRLLVLCLIATLGSALFTSCKDDDKSKTVDCKVSKLVLYDSLRIDSVPILYDSYGKINAINSADGLINFTYFTDSILLTQNGTLVEVMYLNNGKWASSKAIDTYTLGDSSFNETQTTVPVFNGSNILRLDMVKIKSTFFKGRFVNKIVNSGSLTYNYNNRNAITDFSGLFDGKEIKYACSYSSNVFRTAGVLFPSFIGDVGIPNYSFGIPLLPFFTSKASLYRFIPTSISEVNNALNSINFNVSGVTFTNEPTSLKISATGNLKTYETDLGFNYLYK